MGRHETLWEVIAGNIRRIRESHRWSQDDLAHRARLAGLDWSRAAVAFVESGSRELDVGELLLLAAALEVPPAKLLQSSAGDVQIAGAQISGAKLADLLQGRGRRAIETVASRRKAAAWVEDLDQELGELLRSVGVRATRANVERLPLDWEHSAERKVADRLGLTPPQVAAIALALWGRSLTEERDDRAAGKEGHMYRAHATRKLTAELGAKARELGWIRKGQR